MTDVIQEIHEQPAAEPTSRHALELRREAASVEIANRPAATLATMADEDFERGLTQLKLQQTRMLRIIDEVLVENVHYGNPNHAFKNPILMQAGAEELRRLLRLTARELEKELVQTPEYCSARIVIGIYGPTGVALAVKEGACTSVEKRFVTKDGKGFIYKDAREVLHQVVTMARKRAEVLATREATGATGFLIGQEEIEQALNEAEAAKDPSQQPWTQQQRDQIVAGMKAIGVRSQAEARAFQREALGAERYDGVEVFTQADAALLLAAIQQKKDAKA